MGCASARLAPRKRPYTNIIVAVPLLFWRLSVTSQYPAKLERSCRGAAIPSLSALLQPPHLDHKPFHHRSAATTMTLQDAKLPNTLQGSLARPERGQGRGAVEDGWWSGRDHRAGVEAFPELLTLGSDPGLLPSCGVRTGAHRTRNSRWEQAMSSYSLGLNQELRPAQHRSSGTKQVSRARLLLLATVQRVKAVALIREGILHQRYVWKVPISWN